MELLRVDLNIFNGKELVIVKKDNLICVEFWKWEYKECVFYPEDYEKLIETFIGGQIWIRDINKFFDGQHFHGFLKIKKKMTTNHKIKFIYFRDKPFIYIERVNGEHEAMFIGHKAWQSLLTYADIIVDTLKSFAW